MIFPLSITKKRGSNSTIFFLLLCGRITERRGTTRFKGNCHYLCALSEQTLGKSERHPAYKDNTTKGTTPSSLWTKKPRVRSKAISTRNTRQQTNNKVQGQNTYLSALDEYTKSKTKRREYLKKQEPTSKRDKGLGLQLLLRHKTTCIKNEHKTRSSCVSTRLQTRKTSCKANRPSIS